MELKERIQKINEVGAKRHANELSAQQAEQARYEELAAKIKSLTPRIKDLIGTINVLVENDIPMGEVEKVGAIGTPKYEFYTDGIIHNLGFTSSQNVFFCNIVPLNGIGIEGGGCDGGDLQIDENGEVKKGKPSRWNPKGEVGKMMHFLYNFDSFEERVNNYVEDLINETI